MRKSIFAQTVILISFLVISISSNAETRKIKLTGLVVDAESYRPIENASFFDADDNLVGTTDQTGFFTLKLNVPEQGEMFFSLKIKKNGYENFTQNEHWGDLDGDSNATFYFGLKNKKMPKSESFSELSLNSDNFSIDKMKSDLKKIAEKRDFLNEIEKAKTGNDNVYFVVNGKPLLVNDSGYIELNSSNDKVKVNNDKSLEASNLNGNVSRKKVKSMTTLSNENSFAAIFTK
ncbi:MAG: hypothetical protein U0V04_13575 [Spirosomataceae bacterium]